MNETETRAQFASRVRLSLRKSDAGRGCFRFGFLPRLLTDPIASFQGYQSGDMNGATRPAHVETNVPKRIPVDWRVGRGFPTASYLHHVSFPSSSVTSLLTFTDTVHGRHLGLAVYQCPELSHS